MNKEEEKAFEELELNAETSYDRGYEEGYDYAIEDAIYWLRENAYKYVKGSLSSSNYCTEHLISDFKNNFK